MAHILEQYHHLVRYAHWAYMNDDGAQFRSAAGELHGDVRFRKLEIVTPFFKDKLKLLTPNTHVHLGLRADGTLVLAFRGTDFPFTIEDLLNPTRTQWPGVDITCLTLGSPRIGNAAFCQHFNDRNITLYRLEMDGDPIPTIPDRFTQALPVKMSATHPNWTVNDRQYHHVGIPIVIHRATGDSAPNSADFDVERPDITAEEDAAPLPFILRVPYQLGGFFTYWILRAMRMIPGLWLSHDPAGYEAVVQRIVEGIPCSGKCSMMLSGFMGVEGTREEGGGGMGGIFHRGARPDGYTDGDPGEAHWAAA
ncbi:predicted protein [Chaetomium globosum CBS 148.51]|uniref:Fungal lipase-type domain-containing protein n=1 Tax=Chaetomium globosum (strain ATCC 6205 / CBS 148.51 / DSM 1962 / NBRC 6347 / NRRL 1970) TaxID=306901 RepID=Q2GUI8_CHAGB|nr:uncharacterized protein CHGG_08366 [Chaetomium globosum CBS 148.51]EAQ84352.1 predicted protein [Chaetomium globosum CBS 148.51]